MTIQAAAMQPGDELKGKVALSGAKNRVHGSVVKHGLVGMTRALALDLAQYGIRANCVSPGQMMY
ncbi:MAG: SDR family oxidoreductase [Burkholderiales bacterium]|nr:SDR family oxidoreductase [Burkholderiales bacterium]MDP2238561.1 SDR family oxidoreductase [Burkholderiales bacterium]